EAAQDARRERDASSGRPIAVRVGHRIGIGPIGIIEIRPIGAIEIRPVEGRIGIGPIGTVEKRPIEAEEETPVETVVEAAMDADAVEASVMDADAVEASVMEADAVEASVAKTCSDAGVAEAASDRSAPTMSAGPVGAG